MIEYTYLTTRRLYQVPYQIGIIIVVGSGEARVGDIILLSYTYELFDRYHRICSCAKSEDAKTVSCLSGARSEDILVKYSI
mgnify:CR=1 FL=1